jgi:hypothetical protein
MAWQLTTPPTLPARLPGAQKGLPADDAQTAPAERGASLDVTTLRLPQQ